MTLTASQSVQPCLLSFVFLTGGAGGDDGVGVHAGRGVDGGRGGDGGGNTETEPV